MKGGGDGLLPFERSVKTPVTQNPAARVFGKVGVNLCQDIHGSGCTGGINVDADTHISLYAALAHACRVGRRRGAKR